MTNLVKSPSEGRLYEKSTASQAEVPLRSEKSINDMEARLKSVTKERDDLFEKVTALESQMQAAYHRYQMLETQLMDGLATTKETYEKRVLDMSERLISMTTECSGMSKKADGIQQRYERSLEQIAETQREVEHNLMKIKELERTMLAPVDPKTILLRLPWLHQLSFALVILLLLSMVKFFVSFLFF